MSVRVSLITRGSSSEQGVWTVWLRLSECGVTDDAKTIVL